MPLYWFSAPAGAIQGGSYNADMAGSVVRITYKGAHQCTGTVVAKNWVLTAYHCIVGADYKQFRLQLWKSGKVNNGTYWQSALAKAPVFRSGTKAPSSSSPGWSDVVLMKASTSMPTWAKPVALATSWPALGTTLTQYGYGRTSYNGSASSSLQKTPQGDLKRVSCGAVAPQYAWTNGHICAKGSKSTAWKGDSGGPLLWWTNGAWRLIGDFSVYPNVTGIHWQGYWSECDGNTRNWVAATVKT